MFSDSHFIPTYDRCSNESIVPIAAFLARQIIALKKSYATSTEADERNEIIANLMFHHTTLMLLSLSFFTEASELTDLAKEIFRN